MAQGLGYCPAIMLHLEALAKCPPAKKLQPLGFTSAVLSAMDDSVTAEVNREYSNGHVKGVTVAYRKRGLVSDVSDTPSACDNAITPAKEEFNLPSLMYKEISIFVPYDLIRQYCDDTSEMIDIRTAEMKGEGTRVMREIYDILVENAGLLVKAMNTTLVTQASTQFGVNVVTGDNAARALSFSLSANGMQDAFVRLKSDMRENEFCQDNVVIVGNGPFSELDLIKNWFSDQAADNGLSKGTVMNSFPKTFFDKDTRAIWGDNQVGVFEPGSLALISYDKYVGNFAGKLGNSWFTTMMFPVDEFCCPQEFLDRLRFDVQIREIDCPTPMTVNGVETTVDQGIQITLSKNFSIWERPSNLWKVGDPLAGTNGTLRYQITSTD